MKTYLTLLLLLLGALSLIPLRAEETGKLDMEFNIGFYYDKTATENVKRLGGMEMHARICAAQFNQALMSAGIDNMWVNPTMIAELDYNAHGDTAKALLHHIVSDAPETVKDLEEDQLDFIIVFVCLKETDSEFSTLGSAISFYYRPGIFDADDDHEAEWRDELEGSDIEGAHFDIIKTPVPGLPGKVRLCYAYRIIALDLYEALNSFTLIHELGHLFGAGHSRDQNQQRGPANEDVTPYASGSYITVKEDGEAHRYCTVMAYNDAALNDTGKEHTQLPMFSSTQPQVLGFHGKHVLGSESDNNARAILKTAALLSKHRPYNEDENEGEEEESGDDLSSLPTFSRWAPDYLLRADAD